MRETILPIACATSACPYASSRATRLAMDSIDALLKSKVKVDTATNKGSVIGLLNTLTGQNSQNSWNVLQRVYKAYPELSTQCRQLRINGVGRINGLSIRRHA